MHGQTSSQKTILDIDTVLGDCTLRTKPNETMTLGLFVWWKIELVTWFTQVNPNLQMSLLNLHVQMKTFLVIERHMYYSTEDKACQILWKKLKTSWVATYQPHEKVWHHKQAELNHAIRAFSKLTKWGEVNKSRIKSKQLRWTLTEYLMNMKHKRRCLLFTNTLLLQACKKLWSPPLWKAVVHR